MSVIRFPGTPLPDDDDSMITDDSSSLSPDEAARQWRKNRIDAFAEAPDSPDRPSDLPATGACDDFDDVVVTNTSRNSEADILRRTRLVEAFSGVSASDGHTPVDNNAAASDDLDSVELRRKTSDIASEPTSHGSGSADASVPSSTAHSRSAGKRDGGSVFDLIPTRSSFEPSDDTPVTSEPDVEDNLDYDEYDCPDRKAQNFDAEPSFDDADFEDSGDEFEDEAYEEEVYDEADFDNEQYDDEENDNFDDEPEEDYLPPPRHVPSSRSARRDSYLAEYAVDDSTFSHDSRRSSRGQSEYEDDLLSDLIPISTRGYSRKDAPSDNDSYIGSRHKRAAADEGYIGQRRRPAAPSDKAETRPAQSAKRPFSVNIPGEPAQAPERLVRSRESEAARDIIGQRAREQQPVRNGRAPSAARPATTQKWHISGKRVAPEGANRREERLYRDGKIPFLTRLKRIGITLVVIIAALVVCYYSLAIIMLKNVNIVDADTGWTDTPVSETANMPLPKASYVTNILLLGIDDDGSSGSRSDTIMIASVNTRSNTVKLCSILRDCYVSIPQHKATKINAAYAYGGAPLAMQTVESNFRIGMDKFVSIDMSAMIAVVEAIGGVTIELSAAEAEQVNLHSQSPFTAYAGVQRLDGRQAVCYARIRKIDNDFNRTGRQRTLINAIITECKSLSPTELLNVVNTVSPYLTTNLSRAEIATLALKVLPALSSDIGQMTLPAEGTYTFENVGGASCISLDLQENARLLREFLYEAE